MDSRKALFFSKVPLVSPGKPTSMLMPGSSLCKPFSLSLYAPTWLIISTAFITSSGFAFRLFSLTTASSALSSPRGATSPSVLYAAMHSSAFFEAKGCADMVPGFTLSMWRVFMSPRLLMPSKSSQMALAFGSGNSPFPLLAMYPRMLGCLPILKCFTPNRCRDLTSLSMESTVLV